jgi:DNA-binding NarL/FixJ family response regulator
LDRSADALRQCQRHHHPDVEEPDDGPIAAPLRRRTEAMPTAADGAAAVSVTRQHGPDVVLMDVRMPVMDGIEATRMIAADRTDGPRVLMLTTFDLDEYVYDALGAGASGFILKDAAAEALSEGGSRGRVRRGAARAERHPAVDRRVRAPAPAAG